MLRNGNLYKRSFEGILLKYLDQDKGDYTNGTVSGQIGDVKDTDWHTVTFEATVGKGQAGKDIQNTANVKGENTPPDKPTTNIEILNGIPVRNKN